MTQTAIIWRMLCLAGEKVTFSECPSVSLCYCNTQVRACTQIRTCLYELWCAKYPECLSAGIWTLLPFLEASHRARPVQTLRFMNYRATWALKECWLVGLWCSIETSSIGETEAEFNEFPVNLRSSYRPQRSYEKIIYVFRFYSRGCFFLFV